MRWLLPFALIAILTTSLGCSESDSPSDEPTLDELLAAPTRLELDAESLLLESELFLDTMPTPDPDQRPGFSGPVRIWEESEAPLPSGLKQTRVWVILDEQVWQGRALRPLEPQAPYELLRWLESDRGWVNVTVQVVVELSLGGVTYLLRAPDQHIGLAV